MTARRIFPGPAGLVFDSVGTATLSEESDSQKQLNELFQSDAWTDMCAVLKDFTQFMTPSAHSHFLDVITVAWTNQRAQTNPLFKKLPFLVGILSTAPVMNSSRYGSTCTQCVELKDMTGTLRIALDPIFTTTYGSTLQPGTAIAIEKVGFLRLKHEILLMLSSRNIIAMTGLKSLPALPAESDAKILVTPSKTVSVCFKDKQTCFTAIQEYFHLTNV